VPKNFLETSKNPTVDSPPMNVVEMKCRWPQIRVNFPLAAEAAFLTTFFCTGIFSVKQNKTTFH